MANSTKCSPRTGSTCSSGPRGEASARALLREEGGKRWWEKTEKEKGGQVKATLLRHQKWC